MVDLFFFFQAEDGIRDLTVTGVQTCALPILFNLMRQLGGSVGIALSATLVQRFTAIHRADLAANITLYAEATRERLGAIPQAFISRGDVPALAQTKAIGVLNRIVTTQARGPSVEQPF